MAMTTLAHCGFPCNVCQYLKLTDICLNNVVDGINHMLHSCQRFT